MCAKEGGTCSGGLPGPRLLPKGSGNSGLGQSEFRAGAAGGPVITNTRCFCKRTVHRMQGSQPPVTPDPRDPQILFWLP